jgi:flagellar biosynthesis chaperone FliJ
MVEEEVIRFKQAYLQTKIENMKDYVREYADSIDKCDPTGISSAATFIGELGEFLKHEKQYMQRIQEEEIDDLKREYVKQFQRLNIYKVCECKQKTKK